MISHIHVVVVVVVVVVVGVVVAVVVVAVVVVSLPRAHMPGGWAPCRRGACPCALLLLL